MKHDLGRYAGPAALILTSLANGTKHGYALTKDIEDFAGLRLQPGTLYAALDRLEENRLIESLPAEGRRHPYRLTPSGAEALHEQLTSQKLIAGIGLSRLATGRAL